MKPIKINPLVRMMLRWTSKYFFKSEAFSFTQKLHDSRKVLICMPANVSLFTLAKESLYTFAEIFKGKTIFIFLPFLDAGHFLSSSAVFDVISPRKDDLKIFSVPGRKFLQRLKEHKFDISVNLDLKNGFFNGYVCLKCRIPLRIGPKREKGFPLYNIQLAISDKSFGCSETYEGMTNMLKNLLCKNIKAK